MDFAEKMAALRDRNPKTAYASLLELEALARQEDVLAPWLPELIAMVSSPAYALWVRGFRLLCLQAKWDKENRINQHIDGILAGLGDQKPTAIRQALQSLKSLVVYKPELCGKIKAAVLAIDCAKFKDTMGPLIAKDILALTGLMPRQPGGAKDRPE